MARGGKRVGAGRKKLHEIPPEMREMATQKLYAAAAEGESWAVTFIASRLYTLPKPVTPEGTLDAKKVAAEINLTNARIEEITALAERITQLEALLNKGETE